MGCVTCRWHFVTFEVLCADGSLVVGYCVFGFACVFGLV